MCHRCYAKDIEQLEVLKPLKALKHSLLDLFASTPLEGVIPTVESMVGPRFNASKGGSYPFSLDLVAAV